MSLDFLFLFKNKTEKTVIVGSMRVADVQLTWRDAPFANRQSYDSLTKASEVACTEKLKDFK